MKNLSYREASPLQIEVESIDKTYISISGYRKFSQLRFDNIFDAGFIGCLLGCAQLRLCKTNHFEKTRIDEIKILSSVFLVHPASDSSITRYISSVPR